MRRVSFALAVLPSAVLLIAACTPSPSAPSPAPPSAVTGPSGTPGEANQPGVSGPSASTRAPRPSLGWTVTVYYTAVERFHSGKTERVTGCPRLDCTRGSADLGTYPATFVRAVHDEGTGRTSAGRYLNWSSDTGYWIDDAPRDSGGRPLRPFSSAAADADVMRAGSRFMIVTCGQDDDGTAITGTVCDRLRAATWTITDEFTPGLGGTHHVDAYIGEETGPDFTDSDWYTTLHGSSLAIG